jgi:hypothetical protein
MIIIFKCNISSDIKSSLNNLAKALTVDQPILIDTPLVKLLLIKQESTSTSILNIDQNSFNIPSMNELIPGSNNSSQLVLQMAANTYASNGSNNNDIFKGSIGSIELNIYNYKNDNSISSVKIENSSKPIEIKIARNNGLNNNNLTTFNYLNATKMIFINGEQLLLNSLNITTINSSIHIQIMPLNNNLNISYLIVLKLGDKILLGANKSYDYFQIMCPKSSKFNLI